MTPKIDSGDTAWVLVSAAMVMLMTPGLGFFYGGLVRKKNVLSIATGLFATVLINPAAPNGSGGNGLFYGNPSQLVIQLIAVLASWIWAGGMTFVLLKIIDATIGLRVPEQEELAGLDVTQHGELAYQV